MVSIYDYYGCTAYVMDHNALIVYVDEVWCRVVVIVRQVE